MRPRVAGHFGQALRCRQVKRIQRKRAKGWRMPENAVYVGRPSRWGNPFIVGRDGKRDECVRLYAMVAAGYIVLTTKATPKEQKRAYRAMRDARKYLGGKDLACWCPLDKPCHADVLLEIAGTWKVHGSCSHGQTNAVSRSRQSI